MSQGRHAIKILGLSLLAALGLMAVTAGAAQAALTPAEFNLKGKTFKEQAITAKNFLGEIPLGELLVGTGNIGDPGLNLTIHCESGFATGDVLAGGGVTAHAEFFECEVLGNPNCIIYPEEEEQGTAGTILGKGTGTVVRHNGGIFGVATSKNFTTVYFGGPKCTLPEENLIDGGIVLSFPTAQTERVEQEVCITKGQEALFEVEQLHFGGEKAAIDPSGCGFVHLEELDEWGAK